MIISEYKLHSNSEHSSNYESIRLYNSSVFPQTRYLRKHCHTCIELSLIKNGHGFYKTRDKIYEIRKGDIYFFSTNEEHYITEISEPDNMLIMNIHIDPRFLWMCESIISAKRLIEILFNRSGSFENRITGRSAEAEHIKNLMLSMEHEFIEMQESYETMIKLHLFEILTCFIRRFDSGKIDTKIYQLTYEKFLHINRAIEYIENHYTESLSLVQLSSVAGFSQTHFGMLFKRMTGMSPWDYINLKRINHARKLLKTNNLSIVEIAAASGFNNTTLFNRIFKKIVGLTPSEVRGDL